MNDGSFSRYSLEESAQFLKAIIESALDGVITIDQQGVIATVNPAAARLFGYEPDEIIGQKVNMLMPRPHSHLHDKFISEYIRTGQRRIIGIGREVLGKKKDGTEFPFHLAVSEIQVDGKRSFVGIIHDLTQAKADEAQLKAYSEELEARVTERTQALRETVSQLEAQIEENRRVTRALQESQREVVEALSKERELNELKSRFVSMASHEFRTPLATIMSSVILIGRYRDEAYAEKRQRHVERVKHAVGQLTGILNDFLSLEKLETGKLRYLPETFSLHELAAALVDELQSVARQGQIIQLTFSGEETVTLDRQLVKTVLQNLLSNAIKYSPENTPIQLRIEKKGDQISVEVEDRGMGIPDAEQAHLFERFYRAKNVTNIQGTGLGLNIVKEMVELMNGKISFQSKLNQGTIFTVILPAAYNKEEM